ncbi:hypothetical protein REPUB_Repub11eG0008000 [Reevesia pubescens]
MAYSDQQQAPTYPRPSEIYQPEKPMEMNAYVAPPPPPLGYPTMDGTETYPQHAASVQRQSKGDGFWKGCFAALCCCCVLDACL